MQINQGFRVTGSDVFEVVIGLCRVESRRSYADKRGV